jgi:hypothetical protein
VKLTEIEKKLLALALDPAASNGEIEVASAKLVSLWRKRDLQITDFDPPQTNAQAALARPRRNWKPDYGLSTMPWGKYKGEMFKDIAPGYLRYQLDWIRSDKDRAKKFAELATNIENYLNQ